MSSTSNDAPGVDANMVVNGEQKTLETPIHSSFRIDAEETTTPTGATVPAMDDHRNAQTDAVDPNHADGSGKVQESNNNGIKEVEKTKQQPQATSKTHQQQQQGGDLATANRLLRSCRNLIDQLNKQLASKEEENAKIREEFTKYRVRVELARKNTEMEISSLSEVNLKFKQYNVVSHDVQAELEALKRRYEQIDRERMEARAEISRLKDQLGEERAARSKTEAELEVLKHNSESVGPQALARTKAAMEAELNEVKREFRAFRERTVKTLEDKDAELVRVRTSTEAATELTYLRDVIIKYLASSNDPASRTSMEAAIASVLRFNESEMEYVREKRRNDAGWKNALSALGVDRVL